MKRQTLINRLNQIFEGLFQSRLEFIPLNLPVSTQNNFQNSNNIDEFSQSIQSWFEEFPELADNYLVQWKQDSQNSKTYEFAKSKDNNDRAMIISSNQDNYPIGLLIVRNWQEQNQKALNDLTSLSHSLLASFAHEINKFTRLEEHMILQKEIEKSDSERNVFMMRKSKDTTSPIVNVNISTDANLETKDSQPHSMLLEVKSTHAHALSDSSSSAFSASRSTKLAIRAMALEIHELAQRMLFIPFEDFPKGSFDDIEAIFNMGSTTIFIEDITHLTLDEQLAIARYLDRTHPDEQEARPVFLIGSSFPLERLVDEGDLSPQLAHHLVRFQVDNFNLNQH